MGICSYKKQVNNLPDSCIQVIIPKYNELNQTPIIIPKYNELNQSPPLCFNKHCISINKQGQSPPLGNINKHCINKHITPGKSFDEYYYFKYMYSPNN